MNIITKKKQIVNELKKRTSQMNNAYSGGYCINYTLYHEFQNHKSEFAEFINDAVKAVL